MNPTENKSNELASAADSAWVEILRKQVGSLRFGVVQIVVHDGRVVQIERTEKVRFQSSAPNSPFANQSAGGHRQA